MKNILYCLLVLCITVTQVDAQQMIKISGRVVDLNTGIPIDFVTISQVEDRKMSTSTSENGRYVISVNTDTTITLEFSRVGYKIVSIPIPINNNFYNRKIDVDMAPSSSLKEVVIRQSRMDYDGMIEEKTENIKYIPSISGGLESALPSIALGTYGGSGGELSNQYNVRGGNYDENLVYVNDFQIYRPQLIRQGQQEGLSIINPQLVNVMSFSSGGFESKYGDRLSSVLDIKYKLPDTFTSSVDMSLLGGGAHIEGSKSIGDSNRKFRYLAGIRYKTTKYVLNSLDVQGEYVPTFLDFQANLICDISDDWNVNILLNHNRSAYSFTPETRVTAFGSKLRTLQLHAVYEGQEKDYFNTHMGGINFTYLPERNQNPFYLKFLLSAQGSNEKENIDILSHYLLGELDNNLDNESFGEVVSTIGTGSQHEYIRNKLTFGIFNLDFKGGIELGTETGNRSHFVQWGVKGQYEIFNDKIHEWERLDSAGYSLPYSASEVNLNYVYNSFSRIYNYRLSAYIQDTYTIVNNGSEWQLNGGVRMHYNDLNSEINISPRAQVLWYPKRWKKDMTFKFATGMYVQPPLYRELRKVDGTLNKSLSAQKSYHLVAGWSYDFTLGIKEKKPFKLITELYYKHLWDLVSYNVDNVRIRYSGKNDAKGYVMGIDMRLNGELVPGAESWINLSILQARERIIGVNHFRYIPTNEGVGKKYVSYVPRPTDQLIHISLFLQDYMPQNKNFKVHVQFTFGSGLAYGQYDSNVETRNSYRFGEYHRTDIGFSALLYDVKNKKNIFPFLSFSKNAWLSLEVYNIMDKSNTASVSWIKSILKSEYAVPNHLTGRRFNLRLKMEF